MTGIARFDLLQKVSSGTSLTDHEKKEYRNVVARFETIAIASHTAGIPIYIDAEESWIQPAIDQLIESRMRVYNTEKAILFQTLQMYRIDSLNHLNTLIKESKKEVGF